MGKTKPLVVSVIIITSITIGVWIVFGVSEVMKLPSDYHLIIEHVGEDRVVDEWGGTLSETIPIKEILEQKSVNGNGNLEIDSSLLAIDTRNGDVIFDSFMTFYVNQYTREHVSGVDGFFEFPPKVQKQTYEFFSPIIHAPLTMTFERESTIMGLDVYDFSCGAERVDDSSAWDEFAPNPVFLDVTCKVSVEPISGQIVNFEQTWHDYGIENGEKVDVEIGNKHATDFSISVLVESARKQIQLYFLYETIIPILMSFIAGTILLGAVYREKLLVQTRNLQVSNTKLKQVDRQKEEFTSMIAHELKGALTPLKGTIDLLLLESGDLDEKIQERLKRLASSTTSVQKIIDDLSDIQKLELGKLDLQLNECNLGGLINNVIMKLGDDLDRTDIDVITKLPRNLVCVCDEKRVEQVLRNVIQNSIDFCPKDLGKIEIALQSENKNAKIIIKDNGAGIPKDKLDKIFVKYFQIDSTLKRDFGGTGLGLSICKGIIEEHGGKIWAESKIGQGTSIHIVIPKNESALDDGSRDKISELKICKNCKKKFGNRASEYCSADCAEQQTRIYYKNKG